MPLAFRAHSETHPMTRQHIGAGILRLTCQICPHVGIESNELIADDIARRTMPGWMHRAAARFVADAEETQPVGA